MSTLVLSRLQFALTAMFHILWPVLTIGLSLFLVLNETLWLRTGDPDYYRHARFWAKLFILNFGIGVASGVPLEFEFGTNWAPFARAMGNFFGNILGFEGAMAFMLEAGFLGIMLFGWRRVAPKIHLFATLMVALGASFSAFWIMVANSWMQSPAGGIMRGGRFIVTSYTRAIFNPYTLWSVGHMWFACLETSLLVIGAISAYYIHRGQARGFFLKSLKLVILAGLVVAPLQIFLGDGSGRVVFHYQPAKGAALEGHWKTNPRGQGAPWALVAWPSQQAQKNLWAIQIPDVLSLLATHRITGRVIGLRSIPRRNQPPLLPLLFYAFRLMVLIGFYVFGLILWSLWLWWRKALHPDQLDRHRLWLKAWIAALPLGYIAVECGWIVREVGRQPWIVNGILRTSAGVSRLAPGTVTFSLLGYLLLYGVLLASFGVFFRRIIREGPDLGMTPPPLHPANPIDANASPTPPHPLDEP
jgi:cytochrome d ubiquinol oxidase subunit I